MALALTLSFGKALHAKMMLNKKVAQEDSYNWQVRTPGTNEYILVENQTRAQIEATYSCGGAGFSCAQAQDALGNPIPGETIERSTF